MHSYKKTLRRRSTAVLWGLAVGCTFASGCGKQGIPNVPVSGKVVTQSGIPIDEGRMTFVPDPPDDSRQASGASIGADGSFTCYSTSGGMGIPAGRYKVVLSFASGKGNVNPYIVAFAKYTQLNETPLVLDVPPAGLKAAVIELEEPDAEPDMEATTES